MQPCFSVIKMWKKMHVFDSGPQSCPYFHNQKQHNNNNNKPPNQIKQNKNTGVERADTQESFAWPFISFVPHARHNLKKKTIHTTSSLLQNDPSILYCFSAYFLQVFKFKNVHESYVGGRASPVLLLISFPFFPRGNQCLKFSDCYSHVCYVFTVYVCIHNKKVTDFWWGVFLKHKTILNILSSTFSVFTERVAVSPHPQLSLPPPSPLPYPFPDPWPAPIHYFFSLGIVCRSGLANFCEGLGMKPFRLSRRTSSLTTAPFCHCGPKAALDSKHVRERGCLAMFIYGCWNLNFT